MKKRNNKIFSLSKIIVVFVSILIFTTCGKKPTEQNHPPEIIQITVNPQTVGVEQTATLTGIATDDDDDELIYFWSSEHGNFSQGTVGQTVQWTAPNSEGTYPVTLVVSDGKATDTDNENIYVTILTGSVEGYVYESDVILKKNPDKINRNLYKEEVSKNQNKQNRKKVSKNTIADVNVYIGEIETTSNSTGYFILENIPIGEQIIRAEKNGYLNYQDSITVIEGTLNYEIYMSHEYHECMVYGYTYYSGTSIPVSGVLVSIGNIINTTSGNGYYELNGVLSGQQTITAIKEEYDDYVATINIPSTGLEYNIEMTAQNPCMLYGNIVDGVGNPLGGATVNVLNPDSTSSNLVTTSGFDGHYQISNVPQQSILVEFSKPYYDTETPLIAMANYDLEHNQQLFMTLIPPPDDFIAIVNWVEVSLSWTERPEPYIKGYNLYKSNQPESGYVTINDELILTGTNNYDEILPSNYENYYYKITSVNNEDIEGALSDYQFIEPQTSGNINMNTTWSGIIYVNASVEIENEITLYIEPGTIIEFESGSIIVNGILDAQGTNDNIIFFTSASSTPSPGDWGGIVFYENSMGYLNFCIIEYGVTGIYCYQTSLSIINSNISNNLDVGIKCSECSPIINNNEIYNNGYTLNFSYCGGIRCYTASPEIINNNIHDNYSGIFLKWNSDAIIENNHIHNNFRSGIVIWGSSPEIIDNEIYLNISDDGSGGGIYAYRSYYFPNPTINNNKIYENFASDYGGGIFFREGISATVTNNLIYNNIASNGGGIFIPQDHYDINIINNTIFNNTGGVINEGTEIIITNSIIWNNGDDIGGSFSISYSNIEEGANGTGNISQEPLFIDPNSGNFHLNSGSPCIDSATSDDAPLNDIEGNPRYDDPETENTGGGTFPYYDMGAYEYQGY